MSPYLPTLAFGPADLTAPERRLLLTLERRPAIAVRGAWKFPGRPPKSVNDTLLARLSETAADPGPPSATMARPATQPKKAPR